MIHFDGIKGAILRTQTTVHANIRINGELSGVGNGTTGVGVLGPDNPDALGWTDLGADTAGSAAHMTFTIRTFFIQ